MKGSYQITVRNKRLVFELTINRNITIVRGDSATGKTTLVKMVSDYYNLGKDSGVKVDCAKTCRVLQGRDWEKELTFIQDSIVFIDEGNKFVTSKAFARAIKGTDNYYVIITRENLQALPYSVKEIYGISEKGKKSKSVEPTFNTMYNLYSRFSNDRVIKPVKVITEDSNAGFEFFNNVCVQKGIECVPANGKSNMAKYIEAGVEGDILLIADGAAFGPHIDEVMARLENHVNYSIYLPESFEWLILKSNVLRSDEVMRILQDVSYHVDSTKYFSWEQFFTGLLIQETADNEKVGQYAKKGNLDKFYKNSENTNKILSQIGKVEF